MSPHPNLPEHFAQIHYADLAGWETDNHLDALKAFVASCDPATALPGGPSSLQFSEDTRQNLCELANRSLAEPCLAKAFFEENFTPFEITKRGFVTGYYEPEVVASLEKNDLYPVPLLKKPDGLEAITRHNKPDGWPDDLTHGRRTPAGMKEMPDRAAIMNGALQGEGLELVWLQNPIDAFFIHVQGSARLRLENGSVMRVGYAGKTGHPYTGIARLLVNRGEGTPDEFTMSGLRRWLEDNPDKRDDLFRENRSYIFFQEISDVPVGAGPIGAAGRTLSAGRSLAVDNSHIPYGSLVFVSAEFDDPDEDAKRFGRLMSADDTGSAIKGAARGDIFTGSGEAAGKIAGEIRHTAVFTILVPNVSLSPAGTQTN